MQMYLTLFIAIVAEVIGTTLLKNSESFTRLWPSLGTALCYGVAFYCLSLTLQHMPTGIAYAIWSGVGIVLISLVAWLWHGQRLDLPAIVGMGFIVAGVIIINTLSRAVSH